MPTANDSTAFYSISFGGNDITTFSFFQLAMTSGVITNGGASYQNPRDAQSTYVNFYATAINAQGSPAGNVTLGAAIKSSDPVTGNVMASPPANADMFVTLWGANQILGTYTLPAGQSQGSFSFNVNASQGIPENEVEASVKSILSNYEQR